MQFGRGNNVWVFYQCHTESVDSAGSQPGASSAKPIHLIPEGTVFQRRRNDSRWPSLSRRRSSEEGSSKVSGVALMAREGDSDGMGDSATGMTLFCAACVAKASKGTQRSGAVAVPKVSPGSRSQYPVKEIISRPDTTKCSAWSWPS